jgi:hypothetical protein
MKVKPTGTFAGIIISAILASICCIGPLFIALLGIGSIGIFSSLERYRPFFILITFGFLGMAFYFTYRKEKNADACCELKSNRIKKIVLWVIATIAIVLLLFPYFF